MARKKKTKKRTPKRRTIVSFIGKVHRAPSVKSKDKKVKELEKRLKPAKKEKAAAVKKVRTKLKKSK